MVNDNSSTFLGIGGVGVPGEVHAPARGERFVLGDDAGGEA